MSGTQGTTETGTQGAGAVTAAPAGNAGSGASGTGSGVGGTNPSGAGTQSDSGTSGNVSPSGGIEFKVPPPQAEDVKLFEAFVPDEYKKAQWVQEISKSANPRLEIFKQIENKDKLLGQRVLQVPAEDAPEAEKKAFHKLIGTPDDITGYVYEPYTPQAEDEKVIAKALNDSRPQPFMDELKKVCLAEGIPAKTFQKVLAKHDELAIQFSKDQWKQNANAQATLEVDFEQKANELFGNDKQNVMERGRRLLDETLDPKARPLMAKVAKGENLTANEALILLAAQADGVYKKYIREDAFRGGAVTAGSITSLREQRMEIMKSDAYQNFRHPEHAAALRKVQDINDQMRQSGIRG